MLAAFLDWAWSLTHTPWVCDFAKCLVGIVMCVAIVVVLDFRDEQR